MVKKQLPAELREKETEQERNLRYERQKKENTRKAREERKKEKEENRESDRRLFFLYKTLKTLGYTHKQIGKAIGVSEQSISWMFSVKDDCRLSMAQKILEHVGYNLQVKLNRKETPKISYLDAKGGNNNGVKFVIEGDIVEKKTETRFPYYIQDCTPDKRLYFLAEYIKEITSSLPEISKKTNLEMTIIRYMFTQDDLKISQIYKIASRTDAEIVWKINKI